MLQVKDKVKAFKAQDDSETIRNFPEEFSKSDLTLVYFYPKDDTPGCTMQACGLRDNLQELVSLGVQVFGIGKGSLSEHKKFKAKFNLNFPLLVDKDLEISRMFGVLSKKSMFGKKYEGITRTSFLINKESEIVAVLENVNPITHIKEIKKVIKNLSI